MSFTPTTQPFWHDPMPNTPQKNRQQRFFASPFGKLVKPLHTAWWLITTLLQRKLFVKDLSKISFTVAIVALVAMVYPASTDAYAISVTQVRLVEEIETNPNLFARFQQKQLIAGDPVTTITIPSIGLEYVVVHGVELSDLQSGAGHYPQTPLPGEAGNVAIAGHRTTWGRPFNRLDELIDGDHIMLTTPLGVHTYQVYTDVALQDATKKKDCKPGQACWITDPYAWDVVSPTTDPSLTLTTCHPKGSARERLIIRAKLVQSTDREGNIIPLPQSLAPEDLPIFTPDSLQIPGE